MAYKNEFLKNEEDDYPWVGEVSFQMTLVITKCSLKIINPCNHITLVWDEA
jgi:hypothetical protein